MDNFNQSHIDSFVSDIRSKYKLSKFNLYHDKRNNTLELADLEVPRELRKQGIGSSVMKELGGFADKHGKRVWLQTADRDKNSGTTSKSRLQRFYSRHGFVRNAGRKKDFTLSMYASMYREPKTHSIHSESININTTIQEILNKSVSGPKPINNQKPPDTPKIFNILSKNTNVSNHLDTLVNKSINK
jgi:hypothetical protein